jgi:hypothetical protein
MVMCGFIYESSEKSSIITEEITYAPKSSTTYHSLASAEDVG